MWACPENSAYRLLEVDEIRCRYRMMRLSHSEEISTYVKPSPIANLNRGYSSANK